MSYALSVLIPTKNRLNYLKGSLKCIQMIASPEIEVIIQDNSDDWENVEAHVQGIGNSNLKYFHVDGTLSQTENSELAAEKATGEYVCYIGDDDTICAEMLILAKCLSKYQIDAAVYGIANYNWPDLLEVKPELAACTYREISSVILKPMDPRKNLVDALHLGMLNIKKLPRVYHGIVSRRLLNEVKTHAGAFFPGPSPDMANATACSLFAKNMVSVNMPMIIDGYGKSSAGGMGQRHLHRGKLKGNFQLRDDVEETWDPRIPKLWMQDTIWPNSAMKALEACGREDLKKEMNYHAVYCDTLLHDRESLPAIRECGLNPADYIKSFGCFLNKCFRKAKTMAAPSQYIETTIREAIPIEQAFEKQNAQNHKHDIEQAFAELFEKH